MPYVASYSADFSRWDQALKNATAGLKSFEVPVKGVQRSLENMAKSFSGTDIIKQANLAVAAVKSIGGASALTEKNQQKVNALVTEAIAQYKALGKQAPADLRKLQAETAKVEKQTGLMGSSIAKAGALLAGAFTVGAVVNLSRKVLELGGDLQDLSAKTGIGVEALQEFKFAGGQVGVSLDAITSGINQMQNRIAEGDKSAVGALRRLNISLTDFKKLKPEDQFAAVAKAIGGIQDPAEKVRTAMDLMGKSGAELLPVLTEGFDAVRESARKMGIVLDEQTVAALDSMGDRLDALQGVYLAGFARLLVQVEPLLVAFGSGVLNAGKYLKVLQDEFQNVLIGAGAFTAEVADMEAGLYKLARALNPAAAMLGTFDDAIADAESRSKEARLFVKTMADSIVRDSTRATIALAKLGEVRGVQFKLKGASGLGEIDKELKALQDRLSGATIQKAMADLERAWKSLTPVQQANADVVKRTLEEYEKLRPSLQRVGGPLEDLRSTFQRLIPVSTQFQQQITSMASDAMPDAVRMFNAGQAALQLFNRDGTLVSRTLVDLAVGLKTMPAEVFTKDVRKMAGEAERFANILKDNLTVALGNVSDILVDALVHGASLEQTAAAIGSEMGSAIGSSIGAHVGGPLGKAIGDAVGSLLGPLLEKIIKTRAEKTVERIGRELGISVTEEFAQGIEDTAKTIFGGNRQAARIFSLEGLIDQAGGLNAANFGPLIAEFRDLFVMVESGAFTSAQGLEVLDANFRTFADFVTSGGSLANKELLEIIQLTQRVGLKSAEVSAFVVQETNKSLGGLTTFLNNASVKTQAAADGISAALFGIFEAQAANGVPLAEIIGQLDPLLKKLDAQLKAAGLTGGAAFAHLTSLAAIASHEIAGPLITGVLGLEQAMAGLHNSGVLTEEMFDGLTASVADTFAQILATGVDGSKALQLVAPTLQTIWELSEDFGYSVDAATQALLDEAEAAGVVGDQHRTATEQMLKLTERMTDAVEFLAKAFGYVTDEVGDLGEAIDNLPSIPEGPDGGTYGIYDNEGRAPGPNYASGGLVPKYLAGGGPSGTDTVPAWLTPGEFVMNRASVDRIGASNLSAMNSGGNGGSTIVVNHYHTWNVLEGESVKRVVQSREFADASVEGLSRNTHSIRTRTKAALQ